MDLSPVFLYASRRTGGTAVGIAFANLPNTTVFQDPLNPALEKYDEAMLANSSGWDSNHPRGYQYFEPYSDLFVGKKIPYFPNMENFRFRNSSEQFRDSLNLYLSKLIELSASNGSTPVFKFEQLEGHAIFLKEMFPFASHVGIVREKEDQFKSWLEQYALGNRGFFDSVRNYIENDLPFFTDSLDIPDYSLETIFDIYFNAINRIRDDLDFCINIYSQNAIDIEQKILARNNLSFPNKKLLLDGFKGLQSIEERPDSAFKFDRLLHHSISLTQQRDELTQQRDQILGSTIWRVTKPIRKFVDLIKWF